MGLFDIDDFQEKLNQEGDKFFNDMYDTWERRQSEMRAEDARMSDLCEKRRQESKLLIEAERIFTAREHKKTIFMDLERKLFNRLEDQIPLSMMDEVSAEMVIKLNTNLVAFIIGVKDKESLDAIELTLSGYAKSLRKLGFSKALNRFWAEIFYLNKMGIMPREDTISYILRLLNKEIGGSKDESLDENDTIENTLKTWYLNFRFQPYWGYDFDEDPIEQKVKDRLQYFSENIIADEKDRYGVVHGLERYIKAHTIERPAKQNKGSVAEKSKNKTVDNDTKMKNSTEIKPKKPKKISFPELEQHFKPEEEIDESLELNGFFDFTTRSRNKKVEKLQDKRAGLREDIDDNKEELYSFLKSNVEVIRKLISKEKMLTELEEKKASGKISRSDYKDKKEDIKEDMSDLKDEIKDNNKEIKNEFSHLLSNIEAYNKVNSELYSLTNNEHYNEVYQVSGSSIHIAQTISKNERMTDSKILSDLFSSVL